MSESEQPKPPEPLQDAESPSSEAGQPETPAPVPPEPSPESAPATIETEVVSSHPVEPPTEATVTEWSEEPVAASESDGLEDVTSTQPVEPPIEATVTELPEEPIAASELGNPPEVISTQSVESPTEATVTEFSEEPVAATPTALEEPAPTIPAPSAPSAPPAAATPGGKVTLQERWQQVQQLWQRIAPILRKLWEFILAFLLWVWKVWKATIPLIRKLLPETWNRRLPDFVLTGIAATLLVLFFWIPSALSPNQPAASQPAGPVAVDQPRQPAPKPALNPEKLLAIQTQLSEVATPYAEGLVESVQVSPYRSRLTVSTSSGWYRLDTATQDKLANELQRRSTKLKFEQLELVDRDGDLVARTPVVGSNMVVFLRNKAIEEPEVPEAQPEEPTEVEPTPAQPTEAT